MLEPPHGRARDSRGSNEGYFTSVLRAVRSSRRAGGVQRQSTRPPSIDNNDGSARRSATRPPSPIRYQRPQGFSSGIGEITRRRRSCQERSAVLLPAASRYFSWRAAAATAAIFA